MRQKAVSYFIYSLFLACSLLMNPLLYSWIDYEKKWRNCVNVRTRRQGWEKTAGKIEKNHFKPTSRAVKMMRSIEAKYMCHSVCDWRRSAMTRSSSIERTMSGTYRRIQQTQQSFCAHGTPPSFKPLPGPTLEDSRDRKWKHPRLVSHLGREKSFFFFLSLARSRTMSWDTKLALKMRILFCYVCKALGIHSKGQCK